MQRQSHWNPGNPGEPAPATPPLVMLFERNDAVAVPLLAQLRMAGYDVRAARIPVEVFDLLQREPVALVLVDLSNAAANRREFWVGLDTQRRGRAVHVLTFRYMTTGDTGSLEEGQRVARADVEVISAQGFGPLIDAIRARLPGVQPIGQWNGPPNQSQPLGPATPAWPPMPPAANGQHAGNSPSQSMPNPASSPFAKPYSDNPFKRRPGGTGSPTPSPNPSQPPPYYPASSPFAAPPPTPSQFPGAPPRPASQPVPSPYPSSQDLPSQYGPASPFGPSMPPNGGQPPPPRPGSPPSTGHYAGFGTPGPSAPPLRGTPERRVEDAWTPPEAVVMPLPPSQRGAAYRGYDDEPLAPDDPRIEDHTAPVPVLAFDEAAPSSRNERALSTILMDSAVISPQRLDALRGIQFTLQSVGMNFSLAELAMLFKFLTPDQLLAAFLVSRGLVTPEQIASLGRIKQELQATGKDYDLETLLIMFNILPPDQVRRLRAELG